MSDEHGKQKPMKVYYWWPEEEHEADVLEVNSLRQFWMLVRARGEKILAMKRYVQELSTITLEDEEACLVLSWVEVEEA